MSDIGDAIDAAVHAAVDSRIVHIYESDADVLRHIFELDQYRAEIRKLDDRGSGGPWHVVVSGPDPSTDFERHRKVWSGSFGSESAAIDAGKRQLRRHGGQFEERGQIVREIRRTVARSTGQFADIPEDEQPPGFACDPMLRIAMHIDGVSDPDTRLETEEAVAEILSISSQNIYTTVIDHHTVTLNFIAYANPSFAELWSSLNRKVVELKEWYEDEMGGDTGRGMSVILDAGDPERAIAEEPGQQGIAGRK